MRLTEVRRRRIWGNFAGISLLIAVRRPERSESPQSVAKFLKEILSSEFGGGGMPRFSNKIKRGCF